MTDPTGPGPRRAEVVGAGIAGLSAATALARRGWQVRVHERGAELREIGAGIFLWENALRGLEAIGALDAAVEHGELDRFWEFRDERLRLLQSGWMMDDARLYTVLRPDLHRALVLAAQDAGIEIITGVRVDRATPEGTLLFEDGTEIAADLVVGADGVGSRVRDGLQLGLEVKDLRDGCSRHLIDREPVDPVGRTLEYWNGGRRVGVVPCSPTSVYIYLCCPSDDLSGRAFPLDRESWIGSFPTLAHVIERIPDESRWIGFSNVTCHAWSSGRTAIIGDAAHAMAPNLGQGAAVAITSAVALAATLGATTDIPAGLRAWERSERPVVDATQRYSRIYGRIGTSWPRPLLSARSGLVWAVGRSARIQRRVNVAAHHHPAP